MSQKHVLPQMIDNPHPNDWKELQIGVQRLLRNIGLDTGTEIRVATPRGSVEIDVLAVDVASVDKIKYVVECKNWNTSIPQTVVHAFTTVMHETGGNIGFIVSRHGLQSGAEEYTRNTNIIGLTYLELQQRYFNVWWERYFCPRVGDAADRVMTYVEPYNPLRDKLYDSLSEEDQLQFDLIQATNSNRIFTFSTYNFRTISPTSEPNEFTEPPKDLESYKITLASIAPDITWKSATFRELLEEILSHLNDIETKLNSFFGGQHIDERSPLSKVSSDGPPLQSSIVKKAPTY